MKTFGRLWERRLVLETGNLKDSGGYDELILIAVCFSKLLDFERRFQSHPQPLLNTAAPRFLIPEKVCLSVRHSSRKLPSKSQTCDKPPPNNGRWLSERRRQRQFLGWPDWSVKQQPRKC